MFKFEFMSEKIIFVVCVFTTLLSSCKERQEKNNVIQTGIEKLGIEKEKNRLEFYVVDFKGFETYLKKQDDKVYVINFWATWCAPCVKELPFFEKIKKEYSDKNIEVILVSIDFPHVYKSKLQPFIEKYNLKSKVVVLDDVDGNAWISKVNKDWSGSIPATIIYKNKNSKFFEKSFTYEELEKEVKQFFN